MNVLAVLVFLAVGVSSTLLIRGLAAARRGPGGPVHDLMEVAFLNGGPARAVDTALAAMCTDGRLMLGGPGIVAVRHHVAHNHVERAVLDELAAAPSGALHTLRLAVMRNPAVQEIGDGLAARGLMVPPGSAGTWRVWSVWQSALSAVLLPVSLVLTFAQYVAYEGLSDLPFPFIVKVLPACFAGVVIGLVCLSHARSRVTGAGRRAAAEYRLAHAYGADTGHLVAVGGLRAVPDPVLQAQLIAAARLVRSGRQLRTERQFVRRAVPGRRVVRRLGLRLGRLRRRRLRHGRWRGRGLQQRFQLRRRLRWGFQLRGQFGRRIQLRRQLGWRFRLRRRQLRLTGGRGGPPAEASAPPGPRWSASWNSRGAKVVMSRTTPPCSGSSSCCRRGPRRASAADGCVSPPPKRPEPPNRPRPPKPATTMPPRGVNAAMPMN